MDIYQRLNYSRGITAQSPTIRYRVLYPDVNRIMTACVVELASERLSGVVVDTTCYFCETDDEFEAHYLCALLNAPMIDERLGALRRKEQKTHPHVHKKIFDVAAFPLYDTNDAKHRELAELGRVCAQKVSEALDSGVLDKNLEIGSLRRRTRELLAAELAAIDDLARALVK